MLAALDLGTHNCRLLIAKNNKKSFSVVENFSQAVRLGEGVWETGNITPSAMDRATETLQEMSGRLQQYDIPFKKLVATEACRVANNSHDFLKLVRKRTGLTLKVISQKQEAYYGMLSCLSLLDTSYDRCFIFDIGGGSIDISWVNLKSSHYKKGGFWVPEIIAYHSIPMGVVSLSSQFSASENLGDLYTEVSEAVYQQIKAFFDHIKHIDTSPWKSFHLMGMSGTVTTVAALSLQLEKYNRYAIDGSWFYDHMLQEVIQNIQSYKETLSLAQEYLRKKSNDLIHPGCAILQGILNFFPQIRIRIADRGIREGILQDLLMQNYRK